MKKIYWIIGLLLFTLVGDRLGGFVLKKITNSSEFRYSRLYNNNAESDILLVGNSRGLTFYQPYIEEITKENTFNISYNGMPIDLARVLVEDYLDKYEAPRVMVLDVTMCDRTNKSLISGFNLYTPYSPRLGKLLKDSIPKVAYAGQLSHLYLHNSEVFQRTVYHLKKNDEDWLLDRQINDFMVKDVVNQNLHTLIDSTYFDKYLMVELNTIINAAKEKGVDVKLVVNPYYPPYLAKLHDLDEFVARIEKATKMKVHNYSKSITDIKGFGDYQHLNKYGSRLYMDQLKRDHIF